MTSGPLIIAHRGFSALSPENTLAAFQMAIEARADGVEFDVQLSKDGLPVVFHDFDLRRIAKRKVKIRDLSAYELTDVDVGAWFNHKHKKHAEDDFAGEGIPTLHSVIEMLSDFKGKVYIELKADEFNVRELTAAVCELIKSSPFLPQIILKSFRLAAIPEVRRLLPGVQTAALFAPQIMDYLRRRKHIIALAKEFGADQISLHRALATAKLTSLAAHAGLPVTVWTVDDPKWIDRSRKRGVTALITNDPAKMLAARGPLIRNS